MAIEVIHEPFPKPDPKRQKLVDPNKLARALADPKRVRYKTDVKIDKYAKDQK